MLNIGFDALIEACFIDNKNDYGINYSADNVARTIVKTIGEVYEM